MDIIERVARAIAEAEQEDFMEDYSRYIANARAAIAAMREPTEEMVEAGRCWPSPPSRRATIQTYQWMIDRILKDT